MPSNTHRQGVYTGWLSKKATNVSAYFSLSGWRNRYCVVQDDKLEYFKSDTSKEPRGALMFGENCKVIHEGLIRGKYVFSIEYGDSEPITFGATNYADCKRWESVINTKIRVASMQRSRTSSLISVPNTDSLHIEMGDEETDTSGSEEEDESDSENTLHIKQSKQYKFLESDNAKDKGAKERERQMSTLDVMPPTHFEPLRNCFFFNDFVHADSNWQLVSLQDRLRIFEMETMFCDHMRYSTNGGDDHSMTVPMFKSQGIIKASATKVFRLLMDLAPASRGKWDSVVHGGSVLKQVDAFNDVVEITTHSKIVTLVAGFGQMVRPRRFIVHRHWRRDHRGVFEVSFRSVPEHQLSEFGHNATASHTLGYLTGMVLRIVPTLVDDSQTACIVSSTASMDLGGWVWPREMITRKFSIDFVASIAGLRKIVENDRSFDVPGITPEIKPDLVKTVERIRMFAKASASGGPTLGTEQAPSASVLRAKQLVKEQQERIKREQQQQHRPDATVKDPNKDAEQDAAPELNYTYRVPESTIIFPMARSPNGQSAWWDSGVEVGSWNVRGPNYLVDRVKMPNEVSAMELVQTQWSLYDTPKNNIAEDKDELIQREHVGRKDRPFLLVINFMVPTIGNYVAYFAKRRGIQDDKFDRMFDEFINGTDEHRDNRFKIIPRAVEGSYIARKGIGSTPAILGRKITTRYFRGDNYFEICPDIGSSRVAGRLMGLVKGYASSIVVDLGFLFESQKQDELPERLIGGVRIHHPLMAHLPASERPRYLNPAPEEDQEQPDRDATQEQTGERDSHARMESLERELDEAEAPTSPPNAMDTVQSMDYVYSVPDVTSVFPYAMTKAGQTSWWDSGTERGFWKVRGPNYLEDKVKIPNDVSAMELLQVQWSFYETPKRTFWDDPEELIQREHVNHPNRPFVVIINFIVPGVGNMAAYFAKRRSVVDSKFDRMLDQFVNGTDEYRNSRFKIIPQVVEGYYIVKKGVGNTPAILGKKLTTTYHKGPNCFEIAVDVGSSRVAGRLMSLVKGYASNIVVDLAFLLESQSPDELPERILGGVRFRQPLMEPVHDRKLYLKPEAW